MKYFKLPVIIILLLKSLLTNAQTEYRFYKYATDDGLSYNTVSSIIQDNKGFLWFGTPNGLNRFDGYSFKQFVNSINDSTSIPFNSISTICIDKNDNIWIGSRNGGMCFFNRKEQTFRHYFFNANDKNSLSSNSIKHIIQDENGNLWIATGNGLNYYNVSEGQFKLYKADSDSEFQVSSNKLQYLLIDSRQRLWIGTRDKGIDVIDLKTGDSNNFQNNPDDPNSLSGNRINNIYETRDGNIWIGTYSNGLNSYNSNNKNFKRYFDLEDEKGFNSKSARWILEDSNNNLWIATWGRGVYLFDKKNKEFKRFYNKSGDKFSISDSRVLAICEDRSGQIWFGTQSGLNRLDPSQTPITHYYHNSEDKNSLSNNYIYSFTIDLNDNIWIGTSKGLNKYNPYEGRYYHYFPDKNDKNSLYSNATWDVLQDSKKRIWLGNTGGILMYNPKEDNFERFDNSSKKGFTLKGNNFLGIVEDHDGKLWIPTWSNGINYLNPDNGENKNFIHDPDKKGSLSSNGGASIFVDSRNRVWVGHFEKGLDLFNRKNQCFTNFIHNPNNTASIPENFINDIFEDSDKQIWICTDNYLLHFQEKDSSFIKVNLSGFEPNSKFFSTAEDANKNLWIGTIKGLYRFNRNDSSVTTFDKEDGLPGDMDGNSLFDSKTGKLYYGTKNGLIEFNPDSLKQNFYKPPLVITKFLLFNKEVKPGRNSPLKGDLNITPEVILTHNQNMFAFEFSALNYRQSKKNQYAYKLEGVNENWIYTDYKNRRATFTGISPGKYTFKVKASNDDGLWNEEGLSIKVAILPPWWKTTWAKTIWFILIAGSLFLVYQIRISMLKKQKIILEKQVEERTIEIQAQAEELKTTNERLVELDSFKQSMTGMIVHDLKNPLNVIINTSDTKPQTGLTRVKNAGHQMLNMVLNILDVYKYEETGFVVDKVNCLLNFIVQNAIKDVQFLAEQKRIIIKNEINTDVGVKGDETILQRVVENLLTNAIKYTPLNQVITVSVNDTKNDCVIVSVTDTGSGIPEDKLHTIFDKFKQIDAKSSGDVRSTGLGLTFCKMAIEAHGGEIGVKSKVGGLPAEQAGKARGTTFWFTLTKTKTPQTSTSKEIKDKTELKSRIQFNELEKEFLQPYIKRMKDFLVYETSDIKEILMEIENESGAIQNWKREIEDCLYSMNGEKYKELINI